jgi:hypothetical protein
MKMELLSQPKYTKEQLRHIHNNQYSHQLFDEDHVYLNKYKSNLNKNPII